MLYIDKVIKKTDIKGKPYLIGDCVFNWGLLDGDIDVKGNEIVIDTVRTKPYGVFGFNMNFNNYINAKYFIIKVTKTSLNETYKLEFNGKSIMPAYISDSSGLTYKDCNGDFYAMINDPTEIYYEIPEGASVAQLVFNPDMKRYKDHMALKGKPSNIRLELYLANEITVIDRNQIPVNMIKSANWRHLSDTGALETIDVNKVKFSAAAFDKKEGKTIDVFNKSEFISKVAEDYRYVKISVNSPFDDEYIQKTAKKPEDIVVYINDKKIELVNGFGVSMMNGVELYYEIPLSLRKVQEKDIRLSFPAYVLNTNYSKSFRNKSAVLEVGQEIVMDLFYVKNIA